LKINNGELYEFLLEHGVVNLYHANTVSTAITFIERRGLLSRGDVEEGGLVQTFQKSDQKDKIADVWFDVFLDTADLHRWFKRQNKYGPVLFKFNMDFFLEDDLDIWITKDNPMYWGSSLSEEDKYFQSIDELRELWNVIDRQKMMFTIRKPGRPVLFNSLEEIIIDDPRVEIFSDCVLSSEMEEALDVATSNNLNLRKKVRYRKGCDYCYCYDNYSRQVSERQLARLFLPCDHEYYPD